MTIPRPDAHALAAELRRTIRGEARFDDGSRALYAADASNYRLAPIGVVVPRSVEDVVVTVAACRRYGAPVVSRGGGTSQAGQCCNVAVIIDMSKYLNRILELDPDAKTARVEPGCMLDDLREAAERHHLTFAPDPSTHTYNTFVGMIGNNACGIHELMGGKTADNIIELDVLLYDGTRMTVGRTEAEEFDRIAAEGGRRAEISAHLGEQLPENGFPVARALGGSEGTCVVVLSALVQLVDSPPARSLLVLGYPENTATSPTISGKATR